VHAVSLALTLLHAARRILSPYTTLFRSGGEAPTVDVSKPSVPSKRLTDIGADYFGWADDGKTISWAVGASFFRQPLSAITFEPRSEEHTSELQSRVELVCRLLLEKKQSG